MQVLLANQDAPTTDYMPYDSAPFKPKRIGKQIVIENISKVMELAKDNASKIKVESIIDHEGQMLKVKSQRRANNWGNTLSGDRKLRLEAHTMKSKQEEVIIKYS
jgi:hypothetical protein